MIHKPASDRSRWDGLVAVFWLFLLLLLELIWLRQRPVDWLSFLLLALAPLTLAALVRVLYRSWGAFNLEYWLNRDALRIRWAATTQTIPLDQIDRIERGVKENRPRISFVHWPSPYVLFGRRSSLRQPIERFATRTLDRCLILHVGPERFAISPARPSRFLKVLDEMRSLGPSRQIEARRDEPLECVRSTLGIPLARGLLGAGAIGALLLFGVLMIQYPSLPERLIFHYSSSGVPDSIRAKSSLFLLPFIGTLALLFNSIGGLWMMCRRERTGAYLLWTGTITVQSFSLLALLSLIR